jgi:hypothetical protein
MLGEEVLARSFSDWLAAAVDGAVEQNVEADALLLLLFAAIVAAPKNASSLFPPCSGTKLLTETARHRNANVSGK